MFQSYTELRILEMIFPLPQNEFRKIEVQFNKNLATVSYVCYAGCKPGIFVFIANIRFS